MNEWPIKVEARCLIDGVVVFGGERWRCEEYRELVYQRRGIMPELVEVNPPVLTYVKLAPGRTPWPRATYAHTLEVVDTTTGFFFASLVN